MTEETKKAACSRGSARTHCYVLDGDEWEMVTMPERHGNSDWNLAEVEDGFHSFSTAFTPTPQDFFVYSLCPDCLTELEVNTDETAPSQGSYKTGVCRHCNIMWMGIQVGNMTECVLERHSLGMRTLET